MNIEYLVYLLLMFNMFSCGIYRNQTDIADNQINHINGIRQKISQEDVITKEYNYYFPVVGMPPSIPLMPQSGTPVYLPNFVDVEAGCNWIGVAGQVFDIDENPISGLVVEVSGTINDKDVLFIALSDTAQKIGAGGFEIEIDSQPIEGAQNLYIQVMNLDGEKLSRKINFDTRSNCDENLMLINFVEH